MNRIAVSVSLLLLTAGAVRAGTCQKGDCQDGWGVYRWNDGSTFTGNFLKGNPDGQGQYTDPKGHKYHVLYVDGAPVSSSPVTAEEELLAKRHREAEKYDEAGLLYLERKNFDSAIFFFNKAITFWPDNPNYLEHYHRAKNKIP